MELYERKTDLKSSTRHICEILNIWGQKSQLLQNVVLFASVEICLFSPSVGKKMNATHLSLGGQPGLLGS